MKKYLLIFLSLSFSGCASLSVFQPTGLQEIPEISDSKGYSFDFGTVSGYSYTATSDASRRPPTWDNSVESTSRLSGRIRFPVGRHPLELGLGIYNYGGFGLLKYQFLGPFRAQAKKGDFSFSFVGKASASANLTKTGDQDGTFGSGGNPWEAKISATAVDAGVLLGWRAADSFLLYGGGLKSFSTVEAFIDQKKSNDGLNAGGKYEFGDHVERWGPVLGLLYSINPRFSIHLEAMDLISSFQQPNMSLDHETRTNIILRFDPN